jgi:hypothetical protein
MAGEAAMDAMPSTVVDWLQTLELGYAGNSAPPDESLCFGCGAVHAKLLKCGTCQVAGYCQKDCQVQDWKGGGHKSACSTYARLGPNMKLEADDVKASVRSQMFQRIRFYACPYAVHKASTLGRGFLFVQSDNTLATMSLALPKDCYGRHIPNRALLLHYLTLGEYDSELCRDDFELTEVRPKLQEAVEDYDEQKEIVVLMRLRCGHVAVGRATLVPDWGVCRKLGLDYYAESGAGALQLNIDDL